MQIRPKKFLWTIFLLLCALAADLPGQSHWEAKPSNTSSSLNAIAFGNGLFVAVGDKGVIVTSPDGEVWTPRVSGTDDRLPAIAFGDGRFVATRANANAPALTSENGIDWTPITLSAPNGVPLTTVAYETIAFGEGRFMAGGAGPENTEIMISEDGESFRRVIPASYPNGLGGPLKTLTFFRGKFYAFTGYWGVDVSSDGVFWKEAADWGGLFYSESGVAVTDSLSKVAILGSSSPNFSEDAAHTFQRSERPINRYEALPNGQSAPDPVFRAGCYGAGGFVAVDSKAGIWTSSRGEFWLFRGFYASAGEEFRGVAFDGTGRFVAVGSAAPSGSALIATAKADPPSVPPPAYRVQSLKGIFDVPRLITNSGDIGGAMLISPNHQRAAILRDGVVSLYGNPATFTQVNSVNDSGIAAVNRVLGTNYGINPPSEAFVYPEGKKLFPDPSLYSSAAAVNNSGWVAGSYFSLPSATSRRVGLYRYDTGSGQMVDLGNFGKDNIAAAGINDRGEIAGTFTFGYDPVHHIELFKTFRLSPAGEMTILPDLGGARAYARALNASGDVAGHSNMPYSPITDFETHAFLFKDGVLSDIDTFNSRGSVVHGMNDQGAVVGDFTVVESRAFQASDGKHAFLYSNGKMHDLNTLLDSSGDGWDLTSARAINDAGWIVGHGWRHGREPETFLAVPTAGKPAGPQTRFVNVSTRLRTGTGDDALIGGFILVGGPKRVVVRALGPALAYEGGNLPNILADPTLELFNERGERVAFNDNFKDLPHFPDQNEIGVWGLAPRFTGATWLDSAIIITLEAGPYTAVVRGNNGTTGNCLVEVYNIDTDFSPSLVNISTRGPVGTNDDVMIAGFIIRGDRERHVLIRAIGPGLAGSGVPNLLRDPTLEIHGREGEIARNNDWRSAQQTEIIASGLPPEDDREAAVILKLWPGNYTAIVRGNGNIVGNALVEVYMLPEQD